MKFLVIFLVMFLTLTEIAEARRRGRSFGNRGSRSLFQKNKPQSNFFRQQQRQNSLNKPGMMNKQQKRSGGFMKSMMGAVAGTMIGAMLFKMLGINPAMGGMGLLFPILLLAGGAFIFFRMRQRNQMAHAGNSGNNYARQSYESNTFEPSYTPVNETEEPNTSSDEIDELDFSKDYRFASERGREFFQVQHAWSKKDLTPVKDMMTNEVYNEFMSEISEMNTKGETSTLENLMINNSEVMTSWKESDDQYATVKFDVSLIEYVKDKSGKIIEGSENDYTTMVEYWTFKQEVRGGKWQVSAVEHQA